MPCLAHSFISRTMEVILGGMTPVASGVFLSVHCQGGQMSSSSVVQHYWAGQSQLHPLGHPSVITQWYMPSTASWAAWKCRAVWFEDFSYSRGVQCGLTWAFSRNSIALHISGGTSPLLCQLGPCRLLTAVERWMTSCVLQSVLLSLLSRLGSI